MSFQFSKRFSVLVLVLVLTACIANAAPPPWPPNTNPADGAAELAQMWTTLNKAPSVETRAVFRFALEAAGLPPSGWDAARVEAILKFARAQQDLDPASKTFGNFKWQSSHPAVTDRNAAEFCAQLMGLLHKRYAARLAPAAKASLEQMMRDTLPALQRHAIGIDYTNIWLMKSWALIAIGESLDKPDIAADGYKRLDEWLAHTARNGISEFGAVTYYGVDLNSLGLIAKFANRPDAREKAMKVIRYLWTDAAANWWAPGDRLGGANSRSYDYLYGGGVFDLYTWPAGWLRKRPPPSTDGPGWLRGNRQNLAAYYDSTWVAPRAEWTEKIRATIPRMVTQRWGADPAQTGMIAANWIGRAASLASSGAAHGNDDRTLVANLGNDPTTPQLVLFMDGRGDPFGTKKTANSASQSKALHLVPFIAAVQRGPEVLQALSIDPAAKTRSKKDAPTCLLTHLTIPSAAEIWVDDQKVPPGTPAQPRLVPAGALVSVRLGAGALALRILYADAPGAKSGAPAPPEIQIIADQKNHPACRLTIVHDRNEPRGRATVVAWFRAADEVADDAAFATFRKNFAAAKGSATLAGGVLTAQAASLDGAPLRLKADVLKSKRLRLEGATPAPGILNVNGADLGAPILGEFANP